MAKTLENVVVTDPEILGGAYPVFAGTRVPVQNLVSHLKGGPGEWMRIPQIKQAGVSVDEFLGT